MAELEKISSLLASFDYSFDREEKGFPFFKRGNSQEITVGERTTLEDVAMSLVEQQISKKEVEAKVKELKNV